MSSEIGEAQFPSRSLLELLADGALHSGQDLADQLGVSRTAIWKQLAKIEALGLSLESQKGKGYRLMGGIEFLDEKKIIGALASGALEQLGVLEIFNQIDSTNAHLLRQDFDGKIRVCFAESQTSGRGRRGRVWVSPFAKNIYVSLGITLESGLAALEGLSLAVGVAVARALSGLGVTGVALKWPNDLLWGDRKLGGVLIEVSGEPSGRCHLVVGIGLNLSSDKTMTETIEQPWVALNEISDKLLSRNLIATALLNELIPLLANYEQSGFGCYREEWESLNAHKQKTVNILSGSNIKTGLMQGVTEKGALILKTPMGEEIIYGGEVSLRESL